MLDNREFKIFLNVSQEVGNDFNLTQGAGGNTSYKSDGVLFIKASGLKLSSALRKNIFVEVDHKKIINNLNNFKTDPIKGTFDSSKNMKPSIETTMHAVIPHKYVFHLHCLNTISLVIQKDFEEQLALIFKEFNYAVIKYVMPGLPLTREIQRILKGQPLDILFLRNHGLVVAGNSIEKVLDRIYKISNKINNLALRKTLKSQNLLNSNLLNEVSDSSFYRPTKYVEANQIASSKNHKLISQMRILPFQMLVIRGLGQRYNLLALRENKDLKKWNQHY